MTDNEIIKALECCASGTSSEACEGCPFNENDICDKESNATEKYALDLINRQKAEIERLQKDGETVAIALLKARAEIERLHEVINGFEEQSHQELMDFMSLSEKYANAKAEIERLRRRIKEISNEIYSSTLH